MNVLICDPISPKGIALLQQQTEFKVTVLEIGHGAVRLGFEVDKAVPVHRWEVWERIRAGVGLSRPAGGTAAPATG